MTAPASTEASWSLSPSKIRRAVGGTACNKRAIISRSIIDASSTTTTSVASWCTCVVLLLVCSKRCSVCAWLGMCGRVSAGILVSALLMDSVKRAAALPVGAAKWICSSRGAVRTNNDSSFTTVVVLPVPGPPVISVMRFCAATSQAKRCMSGAPPVVGVNSSSKRCCKSAGTSHGRAKRCAMLARMFCSAVQARRRYRRAPVDA